MVHEVSKRVKKPVIGIGGIATAEDALEFIIAGASAVQVGTATFFHPGTMEEIVDGIYKYLRKHSIKALDQRFFPQILNITKLPILFDFSILVTAGIFLTENTIY
jgi:tRNA-dihydrouridine synthase